MTAELATRRELIAASSALAVGLVGCLEDDDLADESMDEDGTGDESEAGDDASEPDEGEADAPDGTDDDSGDDTDDENADDTGADDFDADAVSLTGEEEGETAVVFGLAEGEKVVYEAPPIDAVVG